MAEIHPSRRFWMVCRKPDGPQSQTQPRQRYTNQQDANDAAIKLANQNDHPFVVLESVEAFYPTDDKQGALL